jgi:D-alanine-D-alanine ligase
MQYFLSMSTAPATRHARRNSKTVAVVHPRVATDAPQDEQDILLDVDLISRILEELGYEPVAVPVTLDLLDLIERMRELQPLVVFNLVDALADHDRLIHLIPTVLEAFHIPCTGVNARGHVLTTDKVLAKEMLRLAGLPTPDWQLCNEVLANGAKPKVPVPCIVKPVAMDASRNINEHSVCNDVATLRERAARLQPEQRGEFMAEEFIEGREFNLSALCLADGVHILPPAEMTFVDYPPGKPAIVDFQAKWAPDSFEFNHTVRRFEFPESDNALLEELKRLAMACWTLFGLCGYIRVDYRVDRAGKPWILEINANPCISPDAGFVAAGERAGFSYQQLIQAIVEDALRRNAEQHRDDEHKARRRARRAAIDKKR